MYSTHAFRARLVYFLGAAFFAAAFFLGDRFLGDAFFAGFAFFTRGALGLRGDLAFAGFAAALAAISEEGRERERREILYRGIKIPDLIINLMWYMDRQRYDIFQIKHKILAQFE